MNLKDININPISHRWKERYSQQSDVVKDKLDSFKKMKPKDYQLKVIKRSKNKPVDGDVFVLSPRDGVYFFGKVLNSDIQHIREEIFLHRKCMVCIFESKCNKITIDEFISDYSNLLINPIIVDVSYWTKGYFHTIGNESISDKEKELDYGFYKIGNGKIYREDGRELSQRPQLLGTYGIASITGVASLVQKELIINPNLLDFK